jgi:16S rRNA (adenine1518-N6/adenine1519-N6)-dimethyltransferase
VPKVASRAVRKPKLGQHFLSDSSTAAKIVEVLGDISQETVLEIGPGRGALTCLLCRNARRLIAIELDRVLAAQLRMKFALAQNLEVIEGDVLSMDFDSLFGPKPGSSRPGMEFSPRPAKVVGNLPYYITSDILLRLFEYRRYFDLLILMVQREVADRIVAKPGGSEYGLLSATTQLYAKARRLFVLPPDAFSPPPNVHSAVIELRIAERLSDLAVPELPFINFLKLCFAQKRKTIWNNLKSAYDPGILQSAMEATGVKPTARAEALSLEKSAALFRMIMPTAASKN